MKLMELMRYARVPIELNGKPGEEVLLLADTDTDPLVYEALAAAAYEMGMEPNVMIMVARPVHGNEPTKTVARAMLGTDLLICVNSTAMTHTDAVRRALKAGVKYISMPGITVDMLTKGAATADYQEVQRVTQKVAEVLSRGKTVRITCPNGTNVSMSIEGRSAFALAGVFQPGTIACFPDGEAAIAPVEGTCQGKIVFDLSMHSLGRLEEHIILKVEHGRVVSIDGGRQADQLKEILETKGDENSYLIGELAVGTNPKARVVGNVSEDKKRLGSVHIAMGDNYTLAGNVRSKTHLDGVISKPTLIVDGVTLIEDGKPLW